MGALKIPGASVRMEVRLITISLRVKLPPSVQEPLRGHCERHIPSNLRVVVLTWEEHLDGLQMLKRGALIMRGLPRHGP